MIDFLTNEPAFDDDARAMLKALDEADGDDERLIIACEWLADAFDAGWSQNNLSEELVEQAEWIRTRLNRGEINEALFLMGRHVQDIEHGAA